MPSITKYCNTYSQTADSNNAKFNNLVTLKGASGYAETSTISKKGGTRPKPSTVTVTNFQFNLPTGAEVSQIKVEYAHRKTATTKDKYPNIPAPTVDLVGASAKAKTGVAPLGVTKTNTVSWTGKWTRATINSSGFGFKITYKSNTSKDNTGKLRLSLIRITVTYIVPKYSVDISLPADKTVNKEGTVKISLSNLNKTAYNPSVTISLPSNVSFIEVTGGTSKKISIVNATTLRWDPGVTSKTATANVSFTIKFNTATVASTVSITARESLNGASKTSTFSINPETITSSETDTSETITDDATIGQQTVQSLKSYYITDEDSIIYTFYIPENNQEYVMRTLDAVDLFSDDEIQRLNDLGIEMRAYDAPSGDYIIRIPENKGNELSQFQLTMDFTTYSGGGDILIREWLGGQDYAIITKLFDTEVSLCHIQLNEEELNRLGAGYVYTVQTYAKASLSEPQPARLWREGKHCFRLGVYNGDTSSFTNFEWDLVTNCENWSNPIESLDTYYDLKTEFVYNPEYPVYVFVTGQYLELNEEDNIVTFTPPVIMETDFYDSNGRVSRNNILYPVKDTINDGESSSLNIETFQESNTLIVYDLPLPNDFGTDEDKAIRGLKLEADFLADDEVIVNATFKLDGGKQGQRSLVLSPLEDNSMGKIEIGDETDLWGLSVADMLSLDKAELGISFNNLFTNDNNQVQIQLSNITLTIYYFTLIDLKETEPCLINDESIWWYGAYLTSLQDVQGLKTETAYLNVKGTDINEPYQQNIKEKEITVGFAIDADTVEETTQLMKSFAGLVTNDRDKNNKPIFNKFELPRIYPGEHWDFILEEGLSNKVTFKDQEGTLKLTIPAGTSFSNEDVVANTRGYNGGIANVNPIITALPTADTVEITETVHSQSFKITYPFPDSSLIEIDCNKRTVMLKTLENETDEGTDITAYVDFLSDWFILFVGEFNFESSTSTIRTVQYNPRG